MAIVIVETLADQPLTPEEPTDTDYRILACLSERDATWRYSLLSRDRKRMLCTFTAPDAEAVRTAYRRAGGPFDQVWAGTEITPAQTSNQRDGEHFYVVESLLATPLTPDQRQTTPQTVLASYGTAGVAWLQSYVSFDGTRLISELNATDTRVIRTIHDQLNWPVRALWPALVIAPEAAHDGGSL